MAVQEDLKKGERARDATPGSSEDPAADGSRPLAEESQEGRDLGETAEGGGPASEGASEIHDVAPVGAAAPSQLGARRFVYAGYFAGAIAIAFLVSKIVDFAWLKLQLYRPSIGEPRDEVVLPIAGILGAGAAVYCWYRTRARELAEEVAAEMSKVTWPTRDEVTNGTVVVILTTVVSTVFFALMDKFWGFITNLVYGGT